MTSSLFDFDLPLPIPPGWDDVCVIDLESRSTVDLTRAGAYKYARHPTTDITMVAWQMASGGNREKTELWTLREGEEIADELFHALYNPRILLLAYNAPFERTMFAEVWGIKTPLDRWQDILVMAYAHAFSGKLKDVCAQMEMPEHLAKEARGDILVQKFCKPRGRDRKTDALTWWDWESAPEDWVDFEHYCRRDVTSESRIAAALSRWPVPDWLWDQWRLDQRINERGAPVDMGLILRAIEIAETEIEVRNESTRRISGVANPNSLIQIKEWLKDRGWEFKNLQKATVAEALARADQFPDDVVQVLRNRQEASKTNWKKFIAMDDAVVDGRLYGMFQFVGAGRTGREAGRIVQLQNLARGGLKDPDTAAELVKHGNWDLVQACYDESVMEVLTGIVRSAITAPEGKVFTVADLKSIESCVLGWEAGCKTITDLFYQGKDTYKTFAMHYFGITYDQVTKEQRTFCKPPVLGCLGENTQVLTDTGWKNIIDVTVADRLWDGVGWVSHSGVVFSGIKNAIHKFGITATPDHRCLIGEDQWVAWKDLGEESLTQATLLVSGPFCGISINKKDTYAAVVAELKNRCTHPVYPEESLLAASDAPINGYSKKNLWHRLSESLKKISIDWQVVSMPYAPDVIPHTVTKTMDLGGYAVDLRALWPQSAIFVRFLGGITRTWRWIVSTTMDIMMSGTSASLHGEKTAATPGVTESFTIREKDTQQRSSGENTHRNIEIKVPWSVRSGKGSPQNKSSPGRSPVEVPTYDILNAGPQNRFTILSSCGPLIVHNSGYQLGWFGLIEYAKGMGVELRPREAQRLTRLFRDWLWEIPQWWVDLRNTVFAALSNPYTVYSAGPCIRYMYDGTFLTCGLPSGRGVYYYRPEIQTREIRVPKLYELDDGRDHIEKETMVVDSLTYMGINQKATSQKWQRISVSPGSLAENNTQAIARDLFYHGLERMDEMRLPIVWHTHDDAGLEVPAHAAQAALQAQVQCMTMHPPWAGRDLFLGAEGAICKRNRKT